LFSKEKVAERGAVYYVQIEAKERTWVRCVKVRKSHSCRKCGGEIKVGELAFCEHIGAPGLYATYWYHLTCVLVIAKWT
jgi:hypothetical protein